VVVPKDAVWERLNYKCNNKEQKSVLCALFMKTALKKTLFLCNSSDVHFIKN
jgi:hypothetical protein